MKLLKASFVAFAALAFIDLSGIQASANPLFPQCGMFVARDSYGRGLEAGFTSAGNLRPSLVDEVCYRMGEAKGREVRQMGEWGGDRDFAEGQKQGFNSEPSSSSTGSESFNIGYEAGMAKLDVGAREGRTDWVGSACVRAYREGYARSQSPDHLAPESQDNAKLTTCYMTGYNDGSVF